jgi:adenylate kinase
MAAEEQQQEYFVVDLHLVVQTAVRLDNSVLSEVTERLSVDGVICVSARVVPRCDKRCIGHLRLAIRYV